jgi:flagella basal body P-ring formation protein FlgA
MMRIMKPDIGLATCCKVFLSPILLLGWVIVTVNSPTLADCPSTEVLTPPLQDENTTVTMVNITPVFGSDITGVSRSGASSLNGMPHRGEENTSASRRLRLPESEGAVRCPHLTAVQSDSSQTLTPEMLKDVIEQFLNQQLSPSGIQYRWKFNKEPKPMPIPDNSSLKVIRIPDIRLKGDVVLPVGIYQQDLLKRKILTRLEIATTETLWVAAQTIPRGAIITRDLITSQPIETTRIVGEPCTDIESVLGFRACRTITANRIITRDMLDIPYAVARGDRVSIVSYGEGVTARVDGQAQQNGRPGDWIWVKNLLTHSKIKAQVVDSQSVVIP